MEKPMSMIERVARAIALEALDPETRAAVDPEKWFVAESYYDLARAAIEEMRKPTEAMVNETGGGECNKWARGAWALMIDAALKEQEKA